MNVSYSDVTDLNQNAIEVHALNMQYILSPFILVLNLKDVFCPTMLVDDGSYRSVKYRFVTS